MDGQSKKEELPHGWIREVRQRKAGKTAGKLDVYILRQVMLMIVGKAANLKGDQQTVTDTLHKSQWAEVPV
ncbi:hypothetical protein CRENBAI_015555 [Crenichthys baileyi]|uniref:MBD domain-containing protein n=1 Tax=Crenichthys baileyi TaxID=28760 RepID=A0AAV9RDN4_9TELE